MPVSLDVGPYRFVVTEDIDIYGTITTDKNEVNWGYCQYGRQRIVINPQQETTHKRVTLIHEVLHAIAYIADQRLDNEESLLRSIAAPLLDVLRRNPALVAYLTEE